MLGLQPTFFKENEIFVQIICPQLCEIEKVRNSKEAALKFDLWSGVRDLSFIIPKNFNNLGQKSGGRSGTNTAGGGTGRTKGNNQHIDEDEIPGAQARKNENGFVGLKSPDHLKKLCNMFKNSEHKNKPSEYLKTLRSYINYENPDTFKGPVKTEIINKSHGNGYLHLKVFKILNPKKGGGQGTSADSDSARGVPTN